MCPVIITQPNSSVFCTLETAMVSHTGLGSFYDCSTYRFLDLSWCQYLKKENPTSKLTINISAAYVKMNPFKNNKNTPVKYEPRIF